MSRFVSVGAGLLSLVGLAGAASAADLSDRPYTKAAPMISSVYDWTGLYIGANGGYGRGNVQEVFGSTFNTGHNTSGALAGAQIGYNWQVGLFVLGLEADIDWANLKGAAACPGATFNCASNTRELATFRGRLGWATGPVLLYGTGGLGYANTSYTALQFANGLQAFGATGNFNADHLGYAAGAGLEFGFTPDWSAKLEYLHYGLGTTTAAAGTLAPLAPATLTPRIDTVTVGVNYRWGGPIIAKY